MPSAVRVSMASVGFQGNRMNPRLALTILCLAAATALVVADLSRATKPAVVAKLVASTAFVALAVTRGATRSPYGETILAALILSWIGDVFLLARKEAFFAAGLAAFLAAHVAFAVAFFGRTFEQGSFLPGAGLMCGVGAITFVWLRPHLSQFFRIAVGAYILAIGAMVATAFGAVHAIGSSAVIGAVAFAASDIFVARERFVTPSGVNRILGLPLYYGAQLLLASSVTA